MTIAIRGTGMQSAAGSSLTVPWPTGTAIGDLAIIEAGGGYNVNAPTGWTVLNNDQDQSYSVISAGLFSKVLNSTDITAGSVVVSMAGSADNTAGIITFIGSGGGIRESVTAISPGTSPVTLTTDSLVSSGDTAVYIGLARGALSGSGLTLSRGILQASSTDGGSYGAIYSEVLTASGAISPVYTFNDTSSGSYHYAALVIVIPPAPPPPPVGGITIAVGSNTYTLISIPTYPGLSELSFTMTDAVSVVSSPFVPSQTQTQAWPGADAWSLEFTLPKMSLQTAAPWRGFIAALRGMENVFQIGDPFGTAPRGSATGTPLCATVGTQNLTSATLLYTSGWAISATGLLLAGDYIQLGYHLHQVTQDVYSDSSGDATISIWPSLRESPPNATPLILTNAVGLFRLASNTRTWHADFTRLTQISFKCSEVR